MPKNKNTPKIALLHFDYVLRFFDESHFSKWPLKVESVTYHWKNDKERFVKEVKKKKIDVLIGSIPATAYEIFKEISLELSDVRFIPSLNAQFANKSKENVTRLAWKYDIALPATNIFYDHNDSDTFLKECSYPKVIKKSYGPSNYSGYFVHKVDSYEQARTLLDQQKYHPHYIQDFINMKADIRVVLMGHKPISAYWRKAPVGEWLTNVSQGATVDFMNVPQSVLDLAVKTSKAANAEYFACDIAYNEASEVYLLECASVFAAYPYLIDWITKYILWNLDSKLFKKPKVPVYNWEEVGRIDAQVLRNIEKINFKEFLSASGKKMSDYKEADKKYKMHKIKQENFDEWPSEIFNYQDNVKIKKSKDKSIVYKVAKNPPSKNKEEFMNSADFKRIKKKL